MRTIAIIQARMGSSRLPGKVLMKLNGEPMLRHQINRLQAIRELAGVVVATTELPEDDPIVALCCSMHVAWFRGAADDVLDRFYQAAKAHSADAVCRFTADCPLVDPGISTRIIQHYLLNAHRLDYVSNHLRYTQPRGLDTEVFSFQALERAHRDARRPMEREHVTPYIWMHPERFRIENWADVEDHSAYRWCVDTEVDFLLVAAIYARLGQTDSLFGYHDVLDLMARQPHLAALNSHIRQKTPTGDDGDRQDRDLLPFGSWHSVRQAI